MWYWNGPNTCDDIVTKKVLHFVLERAINDKNFHIKNWYCTRHLLNKMCVKVSNCESPIYVSHICVFDSVCKTSVRLYRNGCDH